jgi:hypothetical protein
MSEPQALLYVLVEPKPTVLESEFDDWYNNEHGPDRVRLPYFRNGIRYKAVDELRPTWLATYNVEHINNLDEPSYTQLRERRSQREAKLIDGGMEILDRRVYTLVSSRGVEDPKLAPVLMAVAMDIDQQYEEDLNRWYEEVSLILPSR